MRSGKGLFPRFVRALRKDWASTLPQLASIETALPGMPKASTFYLQQEVFAAGIPPHLFLVLEHNSKAWKVGQFTVDVIVTATYGMRPNHASSHGFDGAKEGAYRIGGLTHGKDKWWCLAPEPAWAAAAVLSTYGRRPSLILRWEPSSYDDEATVFREAIQDVTRDVRALLVRARQR